MGKIYEHLHLRVHFIPGVPVIYAVFHTAAVPVAGETSLFIINLVCFNLLEKLSINQIIRL
jgi:hypothetical protein